MGSIAQPKFLVVDFTKENLKPGTSSWSVACNEIRRALEDHGCFIALYDKVSSELHKSIFHAADELFDLPTETKVQNINEKPYHGYVGQMSYIPLHEGLGIDYSTTPEGVQSFTNLMWPNGNNSFCGSSLSFARTLAELDHTVIRMLFESYGVQKYCDSHIESSTYLLRFLKYRAPEVNETTMAFPSHTDKSFMTILYQNQVSGLEVRTRDGEWIAVGFPPSSFVVMAGDACKPSNLLGEAKKGANVMGSQTQPALPLIDFSKENLKPNTNSWLSTRSDVVQALEQYGCFTATYDKVSSELHKAIFHASEELFDLPTEIKAQNTSNTPSHGYVGHEAVIPLYEGLGIENATTENGAQKFTNLMWPSGNDFFCETALSFSRKVSELDQMVMRMVSESYGIEKNYDSLLGSTSYLLRLIKYRRPEGNEKNLGIIPHTDKSFMSILHQGQVKGLEIQTKDGQWIVNIEPSPSSFIVMAGDACMAWTNGRIEPPNHRVIMSGNEERYSLGLFTFIRDLIIEIPEDVVDDRHPLQFKPFDHYNFIHFYYTDEGRKSKCPIKAYCGVSHLLSPTQDSPR